MQGCSSVPHGHIDVLSPPVALAVQIRLVGRSRDVGVGVVISTGYAVDQEKPPGERSITRVTTPSLIFILAALPSRPIALLLTSIRLVPRSASRRHLPARSAVADLTVQVALSQRELTMVLA
jgi:hypothetical protein